MKPFARINRLERLLLRRKVRGIRYTMPDGTLRILPFDHNGYWDAVDRINSAPARIVLNATTDSNRNGGAMLQLLHAVLNPVETEEPVQDAAIAQI